MSIPQHNARTDSTFAKMKPQDLFLMITLAILSFLSGFWLGPAFSGGGLNYTLEYFDSHDITQIILHPSMWDFSRSGFKTAIVLLVIYVTIVLFVLESAKNRRGGEEYGSAQWANNSAINNKYSDRKNPLDNRILTQNVAISYDSYNHQRNLNSIVVGGSGASKTRSYTKPNVFNMNTSLVLTDPNGEVLQSCGHMYEESGFELQVFDINRFTNSMHYNPFRYIKEEKDVDQLVTVLIKSTTPSTSAPKDPFWENAEKTLISALMFYLWQEAPYEEQNFATLLSMLRDLKADNSESCAVDVLMSRLPRDHMARKRYEAYKIAAKNTAASIIISVNVRLEPLSLTTVENIMKDNELDLEALGRKKVALFCIIPDNDTTFNCIAAMLFTQIFKVLYDQADQNKDKRLEVPVHVLMEEAANIALPDDYTSILSTMRKRNITSSMIFQDTSQIEAIYGKKWESIMQNCDELLYLGGNNKTTFEYISHLLGKETIDIQSTSKSGGFFGQYSVQQQRTGRELLTPDEVRTLDNSMAILFIRGEDPVLDRKYDLRTHPNCKLTADGGAEAFYYPAYVDRYREKHNPVYESSFMSEDMLERMTADMNNFVFL